MMAPYAIGHLKISFLIEELGYKLKQNERFKFYLTNTLEMKELESTILPVLASLSQESSLAFKVKKEKPILVILGNPPYSGHSANNGEWIKNEIKEYYQIDGKPLKEKNPKWLQDDYVKFFRFAQWKIEQSGEGIVGFITNHSYLDNPTFRGMRCSLMKTFDEIYILDLHGNTRKKEQAPNGMKDENVFDIQQGVAITLLLKKRKREEFGLNRKKGTNSKCKVFYSELWGTRKEKFDWLRQNFIKTTNRKKVQPKRDLFLFVPMKDELSELYNTFIKITDIFPVHNVGIVTARDNFAIAFTKNELQRKIYRFIDLNRSDESVRRKFNLNETDKFKLSEVRPKVKNNSNWKAQILEILYRPFDFRWIFYNDDVIE